MTTTVSNHLQCRSNLLICSDAQFFTLVMTKFKDGRQVWQGQHSIKPILQPPKPACIDTNLSLGVELSCRKCNAHGSYKLITFMLVGIRGCDCKSLLLNDTYWGSVTFNVMTERFSERSYKAPNNMKEDVWLVDEEIAHPTWRNLQAIYSSCLWNDNTVILRRRMWQWSLQSLPLLKSIGFPYMKIDEEFSPPRCFLETNRSCQLFMDDSFIVVRTKNYMVYWRPGGECDHKILITDAGPGRAHKPRSTWRPREKLKIHHEYIMPSEEDPGQAGPSTIL